MIFRYFYHLVNLPVDPVAGGGDDGHGDEEAEREQVDGEVGVVLRLAVTI